MDNALFHGRVLEPKDSATRAIAALNKKIHGDQRVDGCLLPVGDGMYLARKREQPE